MPNLSLKEITDVLEKSGASFGDSSTMAANSMGVGEGVRNTVYGQGQPILDNAKKNYLAQLGKIAEMDTKLAGVYGDPTSPLYIERATQRDSATHMADAPNYNAAATHADVYKTKKQELEGSIKETMQVYDELTRLQKSQETEAARNTKDEARVAAGKGRYQTTATGQQVVVPQYKGKGGTGGTIKLTKGEKLSGFKDASAANYFTKIKEADFKREWEQKILSNKAKPPEEGYSISDVKKRYEAWTKAHPPKTKKATKTNDNTKLIQDYIEMQKNKQKK